MYAHSFLFTTPSFESALFTVILETGKQINQIGTRAWFSILTRCVMSWTMTSRLSPQPPCSPDTRQFPSDTELVWSKANFESECSIPLLVIFFVCLCWSLPITVTWNFCYLHCTSWCNMSQYFIKSRGEACTSAGTATAFFLTFFFSFSLSDYQPQLMSTPHCSAVTVWLTRRLLKTFSEIKLKWY